jgi:hypothetical protein
MIEQPAARRRRDGQSASTGDGETANFLPFLIPGKFGKFGLIPITYHPIDS